MLPNINWANKMNHMKNIKREGRKERRKEGRGEREEGREEGKKIQHTLISQHIFLLNLLVK